MHNLNLMIFFPPLLKKMTFCNLNTVICEVKGDLFTVNEKYALAHYVAEDFCTGAGNALKCSFAGHCSNFGDQNYWTRNRVE